MTSRITRICERLKRLGFVRSNSVKLYGEEFRLISDPFVVEHDIVFVDAIERKSQQQRRVRIPLSIVNIASDERTAA